MLSEIYCEKFHQKRITFHKGLNVVLGTSKADNSIGKSSLMLIIDFAFGGTTYSRSSDILKNVGKHYIGFKFVFNDKEYHFSRSIEDQEIVWKCDATYTRIESMPISDYCEWLAKQYDFSIYKLSFRNAVSRYIRVYGKGNYDEKHPLHIVSTETGEKATIALLKLFEQYKTIDDLESRVKKSADNLQTYTQAQAHNFVAKIGIRKYE